MVVCRPTVDLAALVCENANIHWNSVNDVLAVGFLGSLGRPGNAIGIDAATA